MKCEWYGPAQFTPTGITDIPDSSKEWKLMRRDFSSMRVQWDIPPEQHPLDPVPIYVECYIPMPNEHGYYTLVHEKWREEWRIRMIRLLIDAERTQRSKLQQTETLLRYYYGSLA